MRELYALLVGEAGVDAYYFMHEMSPQEAADFLEGYRRRERGAWERARYGWYMNIPHKGRKITELFPFDWDPKAEAPKINKRQRDAIRQKAAAIAKKINKDNGAE